MLDAGATRTLPRPDSTTSAHDTTRSPSRRFPGVAPPSWFRTPPRIHSVCQISIYHLKFLLFPVQKFVKLTCPSLTQSEIHDHFPADMQVDKYSFTLSATFS